MIPIPLETLSAFFATSVVLALAPGPDNIFVLTQSALRGRLVGLLVTLGLCTGLLMHTAAVSLGVAAIFQASALAFTILKLIGAAYLLYLAWQAFRAGAAEIRGNTRERDCGWRLYRRGILMNVTNPKVSIFFLAFLPQFTDPARGSLTLQLLCLGGIFIVATILVFGGIALAAGALGEWFHSSAQAQRVIHRVAGAVFVGLAIHLAMSER
jgi:threonine/homoserine/homoserine lactone efflux protein